MPPGLSTWLGKFFERLKSKTLAFPASLVAKYRHMTWDWPIRCPCSGVGVRVREQRRRRQESDSRGGQWPHPISGEQQHSWGEQHSPAFGVQCTCQRGEESDLELRGWGEGGQWDLKRQLCGGVLPALPAMEKFSGPLLILWDSYQDPVRTFLLCLTQLE